jgi:hypothetical protein
MEEPAAASLPLPILMESSQREAALTINSFASVLRIWWTRRVRDSGSQTHQTRTLESRRYLRCRPLW